MIKCIKLQNGHDTIVDDIDYNYLMSFNTWTPIPSGNKTRVQTRVFIDGKTYTQYMHRLIMQSKVGAMSAEYEIDHIDRNPLNNVRSNLRICKHNENMFNRGKNKNGLTSKYKGVSFNKHAKKFIAYITVNYKSIYLGCYTTQEEAAIEYNRAAKKYFGKFAFTNEIKDESTQNNKS